MRYNKQLQQRNNKSIDYYKLYFQILSPIENQLTVSKRKCGPFIYMNEDREKYIRIFLNKRKKKARNIR